jgi:hypothetical protein
VLRRSLGFVVAVLLPSVACSLPALSFADYRGKAIEAAEETISQGETAILTAELASRDRLFSPAVSVQLEGAERAASAAAEDFAAVLPPDARSENLRRTVLPLLEQTSDLIARMRFAARDGDAGQLQELRSSLEDPLRRLEDWVGATA